VQFGAYAEAAGGLYYAPCTNTPDLPVHVLDQRTGRDRIFGKLANNCAPSGLAVAPDGKTIIYNLPLTQGSDLMLIESFK
jgi:hypothetical protein